MPQNVKGVKARICFLQVTASFRTATNAASVYFLEEFTSYLEENTS